MDQFNNRHYDNFIAKYRKDKS